MLVMILCSTIPQQQDLSNMIFLAYSSKSSDVPPMKRWLAILVLLVQFPAALAALPSETTLKSQLRESIRPRNTGQWIQTEIRMTLSTQIFLDQQYNVTLTATPTLLQRESIGMEGNISRIPVHITYASTTTSDQGDFSMVLGLRGQEGYVDGLISEVSLHGQGELYSTARNVIDQYIPLFGNRWLSISQPLPKVTIAEKDLDRLLGSRLYNLIGKLQLFADPVQTGTEEAFTLYSTTLHPELTESLTAYANNLGRENIDLTSFSYLLEQLASYPITLVVQEDTGDIVEVRLMAQEEENVVRVTYNVPTALLRLSMDVPDPENFATMQGECGVGKCQITYQSTTPQGTTTFSLQSTSTFIDSKPDLGLPEGARMELIGETPDCQSMLFNSDVCHHWSRDYWHAGRSLGIIEQAGVYRPDDLLSRAEMVTLLIRAYGYDTAGRSIAGGDVDVTAWYNPYLATAVQEGFLQGYGNGRYDPNRPVSRAEAVKLLATARGRAFPSMISNADPYVLAARYRDVDGFAWFAPFIQFVTESAIATGYPDGTFRPYHPMTRAEALKIIVGDLLQNEQYLDVLPF